MTAGSKALGAVVEVALKKATGFQMSLDGNGGKQVYATAGQVARIVGCSRNTAKKYLSMLVEAGCATETKAHNRAWGDYKLYYPLQ